MPDTQAMPKNDPNKGKPDGTNSIQKGPESGGGAYAHATPNGDRDPHYHGPKNDGSEGGETVEQD